MVYFCQLLLSRYRVNYIINLENGFCMFSVVIYVCLNVKPFLKVYTFSLKYMTRLRIMFTIAKSSSVRRLNIVEFLCFFK